MIKDQKLHDFRARYLLCMINKLCSQEHSLSNSYERVELIRTSYKKFFNENAINLFPSTVKESLDFFKKEEEVLLDLNRTVEEIESSREYSLENAENFYKELNS